MKICKKCGEEKPLGEFYESKVMADGRMWSCKPCWKAKTREYQKSRPKITRNYKANWRKNNPEKVKKSCANWIVQNLERHKSNQRKWRKRNPEKQKQYQEKWIARNPEKRRAHVALNIAVQKGQIKKGPCAVCGGGGKTEAHHGDYSKPLEVIWLCKKCHVETQKVAS